MTLGWAQPDSLLQESALTTEEREELAAFRQGGGADAAFLMFLEQRRKTRTWVVGCSTAAATLGVLAGWLAWGRK